MLRWIFVLFEIKSCIPNRNCAAADKFHFHFVDFAILCELRTTQWFKCWFHRNVKLKMNDKKENCFIAVRAMHIQLNWNQSMYACGLMHSLPHTSVVSFCRPSFLPLISFLFIYRISFGNVLFFRMHFSHSFAVVFIKYLRVQSKHEILKKRNEWTNQRTNDRNTLERNQPNLFKLLLSHKNALSTVGCSCAAMQCTQHTMALEYNVLFFFLFLLSPINLCVFLFGARACLLLVLCWHCHIFIWSCSLCFFFRLLSLVFLDCASNKMTHNWMLLNCCLL